MARAKPEWSWVPQDAPSYGWSEADRTRFAVVDQVTPRHLVGDVEELRLRAFDLLVRRTSPGCAVRERHRQSQAMQLLDFYAEAVVHDGIEAAASPEAVALFLNQRMGHLRYSSFQTVRCSVEAMARAAVPHLWPAERRKMPRHIATRPYTPQEQSQLYRRVEGLHEPLRSDVLLLMDLFFHVAATKSEAIWLRAGAVHGLPSRVTVRLVTHDGVLREVVVHGPPATRLLTRARALEPDQYLLRPGLVIRERLIWGTRELVRKHIPTFEFDANAARHRRICDALDAIKYRRTCEELGLSPQSHLTHDLLPYMRGA